ncbi:hypothetical protein VP1G_09797 [Cytospora mali]|uniref:Uncharacterized protein n=1 Tax=Cytospora mali TaxID=578113 RepID=A0A194VF85_CYTMA|nr:hypothetical protein VP1G_09797 [Valsa mali var. pyri (nom. inval.)]
MSSSRSTTPPSQAAVSETSKQNQVDEFGDNSNKDAKAKIKTDDNEKVPDSYRDTALAESNAQDAQLQKEGSSEAKPETQGLSDDDKENEGPNTSKPNVVQCTVDKDASVEFAAWKGSGNPSHPKWGPPPYLRDPSASNTNTDPSGGICPGMGLWNSR